MPTAPDVETREGRIEGPTAFRSDIEGLRAIAVLGVLAFHAGVPHIGGGYVGVDVFYVISGFLITSLMLRDVGGEGRTFRGFLAGFYARRARRILPAATVVIIATLVGAALVQNVLENDGVGADGRAAALFYSNLHFATQATDYFQAGSAPSPFLQYWSLSVEEQFYLLWPILFFGLAALALKRRAARHAIGAGLAVFTASSFLLCILWMGTAPVRAFYLLPPRAWELGVGALLAVFANRFGGVRSGYRRALTWLGLLGIAAAMVCYEASTSFPGWSALLPTLGTATVIAAGIGVTNDELSRGLLSSRPMQWVGRYSFSLYLWHWPVLILKIERLKWIYTSWTTRSAFMLALTVPAAVLSYHLVENPLRKSRYLRGRNGRSLMLGALLIVVALVAVEAFQRSSHGGRLSTTHTVPATDGKLASQIMPTDFVPENLVPSLAGSRDHDYVVNCTGSPCTVGPAGAPTRVVVFGNSHAGHWGTAFQYAADALRAQIDLYSPGGCASFLIPVRLLPAVDKAGCDQERKEIFTRLDARPPEVVVFSNMTLDVFAAAPDEWEAGVRSAIRRVPKQVTVLVLAETPVTPVSIPMCLAAHLDHAEQCDQKWPQEINARLERITREEGARFVDLRPIFCAGERCPAITQDMLIYSDGNHVTVPFSLARGPWFTELLAKVLKTTAKP